MEILRPPDTQPEESFDLILDLADYELACTQAQQRGLEYEVYVQMLFHEALHKAKT
jgi:hypothetical protein